MNTYISDVSAAQRSPIADHGPMLQICGETRTCLNQTRAGFLLKFRKRTSPSSRASISDHRSTDHRSIHPWRGSTTTQGQALSIHSRPSTSGHRSIDRRPTHPWRGFNNHPSIDSLRSERSRRHGSRLSTTPWLLDSANKLAKQVFRHPKMMLGGPVFVPNPC